MAVNEYPELRKQIESYGFQMKDEQWEAHIAYARRKAGVAGKSEDYIPYLLPEVVKEHHIRTVINTVTMGLRELDRQKEKVYKEVTENGANATATV